MGTDVFVMAEVAMKDDIIQFTKVPVTRQRVGWDHAVL